MTQITVRSRETSVDELQQALHQLGIERRSRLVEEQQFWLGCQSAGDRHALLLAAGELERVVIGERPTPTRMQQIAGELSASALDEPAKFDRAERHIFQRRLHGEEVEVLEDRRRPAAGEPQRLGVAFRDVRAEDAHGAGGQGFKPENAAEHARFAAARRPEQHDLLAGGDLQGQMIENAVAAEIEHGRAELDRKLRSAHPAGGRSEGWCRARKRSIRRSPSRK